MCHLGLELIAKDYDLKVTFLKKPHKLREEMSGSTIHLLEKLKSQLNMLWDILNNPNAHQQSYQALGRFKIPVGRKEDVCIPMVIHCLKANLNVMLKTYTHALEELVAKDKFKYLQEVRIIVRIFIDAVFESH